MPPKSAAQKNLDDLRNGTAPRTGGTLRSMQERVHSMDVDVYEDVGMPGELVVTFLRSQLANKEIAEQFAVLIKLTKDTANEPAEVRMAAFVKATPIMAEWLHKMLVKWNLNDAITQENLVKEAGPVVMGDIIAAISRKVDAGKTSGSSSSLTLLKTP